MNAVMQDLKQSLGFVMGTNNETIRSNQPSPIHKAPSAPVATIQPNHAEGMLKLIGSAMPVIEKIKDDIGEGATAALTEYFMDEENLAYIIPAFLTGGTSGLLTLIEVKRGILINNVLAAELSDAIGEAFADAVKTGIASAKADNK